MKHDRRWICWVAAGVCLALAACAPWQDSYLKDAVGKATQTDVSKRFGPPHLTNQKLLDGETTWVYQYAMTTSELHPGRPDILIGQAANVSAEAAAMFQGGAPPPVSEKLICMSYMLTFDKTDVLRKWKREKC